MMWNVLVGGALGMYAMALGALKKDPRKKEIELISKDMESHAASIAHWSMVEQASSWVLMKKGFEKLSPGEVNVLTYRHIREAYEAEMKVSEARLKVLMAEVEQEERKPAPASAPAPEPPAAETLSCTKDDAKATWAAMAAMTPFAPAERPEASSVDDDVKPAWEEIIRKAQSDLHLAQTELTLTRDALNVENTLRIEHEQLALARLDEIRKRQSEMERLSAANRLLHDQVATARREAQERTDNADKVTKAFLLELRGEVKEHLAEFATIFSTFTSAPPSVRIERGDIERVKGLVAKYGAMFERVMAEFDKRGARS